MCEKLLSLPCDSNQINFPAKAGVTNVKDYNIVGDGRTDVTLLLQEIIRANQDIQFGSRTVYFPNGIYLVSDTLAWTRHLTLQGQSKAGVIIRLKDGAPGFDKPSLPKPVIHAGKQAPQAPPVKNIKDLEYFKNNIFDLTIETGKNNPCAIGIEFRGHNQASIRNVQITSGDKVGFAGLSMITDWQGPMLVKWLSVDGFNFGIHAGTLQTSITMEHIRLENFNIAGILHDDVTLTIRGLYTFGPGPAILEQGLDKVPKCIRGFISLVDAQLVWDDNGMIHKPPPAISEEIALYLKNIKVKNYIKVIKSVHGTQIKELALHPKVSKPVLTLFENSPTSALDLEVKETPTIKWNYPFRTRTRWASPNDFGANPNDENHDDTEAIQRAIDSGAETIYFPISHIPPGEKDTPWKKAYTISDTIIIRKNVRHVLGLFQRLYIKLEDAIKFAKAKKPMLRVETTSSDLVVLDQLYLWAWNPDKKDPTKSKELDFYWIEHDSPKPLVIRNSRITRVGRAYLGASGAGELYLEDVFGAGYCFQPGQQIWARQYNTERRGEVPMTVNDGAQLWILGIKSEHANNVMVTKNSGASEIVGGWISPVPDNFVGDLPAFIVKDAKFSASYATRHYDDGSKNNSWFNVHVKETRGSVTKKLEHCHTFSAGQKTAGKVVPLFVGSGPLEEKEALAHAMWTHGHSLQVEYPQRGTVERKGFSAKYTSSGAAQPNWLHFAIPSPVIVNDNRLRVGAALVRFRSGGQGYVKAIHVYDGEKKIAGKDNLQLSPKQWYIERIDVPETPQIQWGLGISILVDFGPDDRWIEISSAGCDFLPYNTAAVTVINVRDFGAVGDGKINDVKAFRGAIDSAKTLIKGAQAKTVIITGRPGDVYSLVDPNLKADCIVSLAGVHNIHFHFTGATLKTDQAKFLFGFSGGGRSLIDTSITYYPMTGAYSRGDDRVYLANPMHAKYFSPGDYIFIRTGHLVVPPIDPDKHPPVPIAEVNQVRQVAKNTSGVFTGEIAFKWPLAKNYEDLPSDVKKKLVEKVTDTIKKRQNKDPKYQPKFSPEDYTKFGIAIADPEKDVITNVCFIGGRYIVPNNRAFNLVQVVDFTMQNAHIQGTGAINLRGRFIRVNNCKIELDPQIKSKGWGPYFFASDLGGSHIEFAHNVCTTTSAGYCHLMEGLADVDIHHNVFEMPSQRLLSSVPPKWDWALFACRGASWNMRIYNNTVRNAVYSVVGPGLLENHNSGDRCYGSIDFNFSDNRVFGNVLAWKWNGFMYFTKVAWRTKIMNNLFKVQPVYPDGKPSPDPVKILHLESIDGVVLNNDFSQINHPNLGENHGFMIVKGNIIKYNRGLPDDFSTHDKPPSKKPICPDTPNEKRWP